MDPIEALPSYEEFIGAHEGKTACIVGAGTSLANQNLSFVNGNIQISVNSSILLMSWKTGNKEGRYWISNDAGVMRWDYWDKVLKYNCNRIIRNSWKDHYNGFDLTDFYVFHRRPTKEHIVNSDDRGLAYCSSVPSSLDFAIQAGCKRIFLFGIDQYMQDGKSHYWQYWPQNMQPKRGRWSRPNSEKDQRIAFEYNIKAYKALKDFADYKGVKVFNCNPRSEVDVFDRISIANARNILS